MSNRKDKIKRVLSPLPSKTTIRKYAMSLLNVALGCLYVIALNWSIKTLKNGTQYECGEVDKIFERPLYSKDKEYDREKIIVMKFTNGYREVKVDDNTYYKALKGQSKMCFECKDETKFLAFLLCIILIIMTFFVVSVFWDDIKKPFQWVWNQFPN
jgi:hypothetical protein